MSATRREAFLAIQSKLGKIQNIVFKAVERAGEDGLTYDEAVVRFKGIYPLGTIQPRLTELHHLGVIYRTKRTRTTRNGRQASVYRVRKFPKPPMVRGRCDKCGQLMPRK